MSKVLGLQLRGGSWYVRIVLPKGHPLLARYASGSVVKSLGACTKPRATERAIAMRAEVISGSILERHLVTLAPITHPLPVVTTLMELYSRWAAFKVRSKDTLQACLRVVKMMEEQLPAGIHIEQITREQGAAFRTWVISSDRGTTSKTARDRMNWAKGLLNFAAVDIGLVRVSPWNKLDVDFKITNSRRPWSPAELKTLFSTEIYTSYSLPRDFKAGADAAYWVPLIGAYTGARCGELCQLNKVDIQCINEIWMFNLTDDGEEQLIKTKAGIRKVPIHSELIRLGFLEYVKTTPDDGQLWPSLTWRDGKPSSYLSAWFGEQRRTLGFGMHPDFHCFRHTVRSQMTEAAVPEQLIDLLLGHESAGSLGAKVYTHRSQAAISTAIEKIHYPSVELHPAYFQKPTFGANGNQVHPRP